MRIFAIIASFLVYDKVKSEATDEEKAYTKIFKRYIKASCEDVTSGCVNELISGMALTDMINTDSNYHYLMEWENDDNTIKTFEFEQENDPFTEEEETTSLTMARWGGNDILSDTNFLPTFKKVRQKVFRWLKEKYPEEFPSRRRRRDTDEQIDAEIDTSFDVFIQEINELSEVSFTPKLVNFGKGKPTVATTTTTTTLKPITTIPPGGHRFRVYVGLCTNKKSGNGILEAAEGDRQA